MSYTTKDILNDVIDSSLNKKIVNGELNPKDEFENYQYYNDEIF
jgi:hypothetical protein